jgi:hypothetical protein
VPELVVGADDGIRGDLLGYQIGDADISLSLSRLWELVDRYSAGFCGRGCLGIGGR